MHIIELKETDSTNLHARRLLDAGELPMPAVIFSDYQTAGRGQGENSWHSEAGKNILCSFVLKPEVDAAQQFSVSQAAAMGILRFLEEYAENIQVKWPNDIYLSGKKAAGILTENVLNGRTIKHSIIGMGINFNQKNFPETLPNPISPAALKQIQFDIRTAKTRLIQHTEASFFRLKHERLSIHADYMNHLYQYKKTASYRDKNGRFKGIITDIGEYGHLIVENCATGAQKKYDFKEIVFL